MDGADGRTPKGRPELNWVILSIGLVKSMGEVMRLPL